MQKQVLVVDDEKDIAELIKTILFECSYDVSIASNGKNALELMNQKKFDLIISDIRMPQMDGVELLEGVRQVYGNLPPVILLTGHSDFDEETLHHKGASAYINKPFQIEELIEIVETVIEANR